MCYCPYQADDKQTNYWMKMLFGKELNNVFLLHWFHTLLYMQLLIHDGIKVKPY